MDSLQTILQKSLAKRGLGDQAKASHTVYQAQQWINEHLPEFIEFLKVKKIENGQLVIEAANSIAAQELQMRVEEMKEALGLAEVRIVRQ